MKTAFPFRDDESRSKLLEQLARFKLIPPQNCVITFHHLHAMVSSQHSTALGSARTAW